MLFNGKFAYFCTLNFYLLLGDKPFYITHSDILTKKESAPELL